MQPVAVAQQVGREISLLQAKILLSGLKFEAKTGMKMSRHVNSKQIAASALGLSPRSKYPVLIAALEESIAHTEKVNGIEPKEEKPAPKGWDVVQS